MVWHGRDCLCVNGDYQPLVAQISHGNFKNARANIPIVCSSAVMQGFLVALLFVKKEQFALDGDVQCAALLIRFLQPADPYAQ